MILVTKEVLKEAVNEDAILCYEQCRILGVDFPVSKSWRRKFKGISLTEEQFDKFMSLKPKTRPNQKKNHTAEPREKDFKYNPHCEPVYTEDGKGVIVTDEWLSSGMTSGIGIKKSQAKLLGLNVKEKGWKKAFIGSVIPKELAEKYIKLKYQVKKIRVRKGQKRENTEKFIKDYLTVGGDSDRKTIEGKIVRIRNLSQLYNKKEIISYIRKMPYREFLKTPYWKAIANFQKYESDYCCVICGSKDILNVHHKTYQNHGEEALHLEDLITVCRKCHKEIHGII